MKHAMLTVCSVSTYAMCKDVMVFLHVSHCQQSYLER